MYIALKITFYYLLPAKCKLFLFVYTVGRMEKTIRIITGVLFLDNFELWRLLPNLQTNPLQQNQVKIHQ